MPIDDYEYTPLTGESIYTLSSESKPDEQFKLAV